MHPEFIASLASAHRDHLLAEARRHDLAAAAREHQSAAAAARPARRRLPRFHVTWTRTTLAAVADRRRARSLVIVISATRTW
jgi:hypothetical protein